jgi:AraC-like DNA-binding protein
VGRARAFLQERFRDRLHLADVSRAACASPDHLTRVFRRETGVTLHEYLMRLRLAAALDTVLQGEGDLTELALELGFANHSHLTYAFRRRFGVPPAAVRRELGRRARGGRPLRAARATPAGLSGPDRRLGR